MPRATRSERLEALTGLRFFAAFHVVLYHYGAPLFGSSPAWAEAIRARGFTAVSFFFVLSGFILTFHHGADLEQDSLDRRAFWTQRIARIFPTYALGLLLLLPFAVYDGWGRTASLFIGVSAFKKIASLLANITTLQAWAPHTAASWNTPGWSISAEMFFYFLFPFVAPIVVRRLSTRAIWLVATASVIAGLLPPILYVIINPDHLSSITTQSIGFWLTIVKFCPLVRAPEFLTGVCTGALYLRQKKQVSPAAALIAPIGLVTIGATLVASQRLPFVVVHNAALSPLFALTIWGLASAPTPLNRLLSAAPFKTLGEASYSLYILQLPVMAYWMLAARALQLPARALVGSSIYLILILCVSLLSWRTIERRGQRAVKRLLASPYRRARQESVSVVA